MNKRTKIIKKDIKNIKFFLGILLMFLGVIMYLGLICYLAFFSENIVTSFNFCSSIGFLSGDCPYFFIGASGILLVWFITANLFLVGGSKFLGEGLENE